MRSFQKIADVIIKVIDEECDYDENLIVEIIDRIEEAKKSNLYKAPELQYMSWNELADILNFYFDPDHSEWEMKIAKTFSGEENYEDND